MADYVRQRILISNQEIRDLENGTKFLYNKLLKKTYFVTIFYKMQPEDIILLIMPEISSRDNNFENYSSDAFLYNCNIDYCGFYIKEKQYWTYMPRWLIMHPFIIYITYIIMYVFQWSSVLWLSNYSLQF